MCHLWQSFYSLAQSTSRRKEFLVRQYVQLGVGSTLSTGRPNEKCELCGCDVSICIEVKEAGDYPYYIMECEDCGHEFPLVFLAIEEEDEYSFLGEYPPL